MNEGLPESPWFSLRLASGLTDEHETCFCCLNIEEQLSPVSTRLVVEKPRPEVPTGTFCI